MRPKQLQDRLKKLGVSVTMETLQKWAKQSLITGWSPKPKNKRERPKGDPNGPDKKRKGPGRLTDWPESNVEEAAAVYAVRHYNYKKRGTLTTEMIKVIKRAAAILDERPFAVYTIPSIVGPLSTQHINPEHINVTFVSEDFNGLDLFPGTTYTEKVEYLNAFVVTWVAAIEKVREWKSRGIRAQIMESELKHQTPAEIDYSQLDPWRVDVPCPWRIDKPARVTLYWWSRPSKNEDRVFWKFPFPFQRSLTDYKCDDIILLENFVDAREFVKIDIRDREGWARAEREKIEGELKEKERILQRLGMKNISLNAFIEMEQAPFESLTERQQLGLKAANEKLNLQWRLAWLTTSFDAEVGEGSE
jgi:hypothetical protein